MFLHDVHKPSRMRIQPMQQYRNKTHENFNMHSKLKHFFKSSPHPPALPPKDMEIIVPPPLPRMRPPTPKPPRIVHKTHVTAKVSTKLSFAVQRHNMAEWRPFKSSSIIHQGWLKKQGGVIKTWQRRYFILADDHLYYYGREDDQRHLGAIPLKGNQVTKHVIITEEPNKFLFEISPSNGQTGRIVGNHDNFLLLASSQIDMDNWIQVIQRVMYARIGGGVFGQSLLDIITNESTTSTKMIPSIVEQCVAYLTHNGLREEGIFRLPGRSSMIKTLQESFDGGKKPDFEKDHVDIHTVASLLKLYLRELPEPVIPWAHYDDIMKGIKLYVMNSEQGRTELIKQLALLPRTNYNLLRYMCDFLHNVAMHENINKMGVHNIATVFGPNIIRPNTDSPASLMQSTTLSQRFVHLIIERHEEMFPPNDMIDFTKNTAPPLLKLVPLESYQKPTLPVAPPRSRKHMPAANTNLDLLKEVKDPAPVTVDDHTPGMNMVIEEKLIDFDEEDVLVLKPNIRSFTVDQILSVKQELTYSSDSHQSFEHSTQRSTPQYSRPHANRHASIHEDDNSSPYSSTPVYDPMSPNQNGMKQQPSFSSPTQIVPARPPKPAPTAATINFDLTQNIPDVAPVIDHTLRYEDLQLQVEALKMELKRQKEDYEQKLRMNQMKYDALEIKFLNEESARKSGEERNRHLIQRVNTFIAEYGPK